MFAIFAALALAEAINQPVPVIGKPMHFRASDPIAFDEHAGFTQMFDGVSLKDWDGDPAIWRVENGAIVGESLKERPVANAYIAWHGQVTKNFDLKLEIKVENGGGSGVQYRSQVGQPWTHDFPAGKNRLNLAWMMTGPQADFWYPTKPTTAAFTGQFYSENTDLGILAFRGQVTESEPGKPQRLVAQIDDPTALGGFVRVNDWNQYEIIARNDVMMHIVNGRLMAVYIDDDPNSTNNQPGLIGIELEGVPSKVSVRNLWIRPMN